MSVQQSSSSTSRKQRSLHRYDGLPLPVDFDQAACMRAKSMVPSLGTNRTDLTHAVIGFTFEGGAGVLGWFNNVFAARHNAGLLSGRVALVYYDQDDVACVSPEDWALINANQMPNI